MKIKNPISQKKLVLTIFSAIISSIATALIPANKTEAGEGNQLIASRICKYYRVTKKSHFYSHPNGHHRHRTRRYLKPNVIVRVTRISDNGKLAKVYYDNSNFTRSGHNHGWIRSNHLSCFKRN